MAEVAAVGVILRAVAMAEEVLAGAALAVRATQTMPACPEQMGWAEAAAEDRQLLATAVLEALVAPAQCTLYMLM